MDEFIKQNAWHTYINQITSPFKQKRNVYKYLTITILIIIQQ